MPKSAQAALERQRAPIADRRAALAADREQAEQALAEARAALVQGTGATDAVTIETARVAALANAIAELDAMIAPIDRELEAIADAEQRATKRRDTIERAVALSRECTERRQAAIAARQTTERVLREGLDACNTTERAYQETREAFARIWSSKYRVGVTDEELREAGADFSAIALSTGSGDTPSIARYMKTTPLFPASATREGRAIDYACAHFIVVG